VQDKPCLSRAVCLAHLWHVSHNCPSVVCPEQFVLRISGKFHTSAHLQVDAKALGLHNYHQVIRRPMDLGTIKDNLMAEPPSYFSSSDVLKDVQQVWANCRTYNDEDDAIV